MVKLNHLFIAALFLFPFFHSSAQLSWTPVANYGGGAYSFTTAAAINGKAYVPRDNQLWEYNPASDMWSQKANFPGSPRVGSVSFVISNMLYYGTGNILFGALLNDWWRYDPSNDSWLQLNYFPGVARYAAVGFSIGSKGYIATGFGNGSIYKYDLWEYNPASDSWAQKTDLPDVGRYLATGFSVAGKGYLITGYENALGDVKDVWEYNPVSNAWLQKGIFPGVARRQAAGFSSSTKGYVIAGGTNSSVLNDAWEYNPAADSWTALPDLPAGGRRSAAGFCLNEEPYVGIGFVPAGITYQDFWKLPLTILPIELTTFTATNTGEGNLLEWSTSSELNNDFFTVERSTDALSFTALQNVDGKGTTAATSNYSFSDRFFLPGTNYYRLRQTDFDGTSRYSQTVAVESAEGASSPFIYYTPAEGVAVLKMYAASDEKITISICDNLGRLLQNENRAVAAGLNMIQIDMPHSLKGICFIVIDLPGQRSFVKKLIV